MLKDPIVEFLHLLTFQNISINSDGDVPSCFSDFVSEWRKHHGLRMKQGSPKSGGDLEGA